MFKRITAVFLFSIIVTGCDYLGLSSTNIGSSSDQEYGQAIFYLPQIPEKILAKKSAVTIPSYLSISITGNHMDTIEFGWDVRNIPTEPYTINQIPAGVCTFTGSLSDKFGVVQYQGTSEAEVLAGDTVQVSLALQKLQTTGTVAVIVTIEEPAGLSFFTTDSNTIGHWKFDTLFARDSFHDFSSYNKSLLAFGQTNLMESEYGKSLVCDTNYASLIDDDHLYPQTITVEALVKIDGRMNQNSVGRNHGMIVSSCTWDNVEYGYELRLTNNNYLEFILGTNSYWKSAITDTSLEIDKWYWVAGQYDGSHISVYLDGTLIARTPWQGGYNPGPVGFHIGRRIVDQSFNFYGNIDELRISKIARFN